MVKMIALYRRPEDPEAFLKRYLEEHVPLAAQMPGLLSFEHGPLEGMGREAPYWYMAQLSFQDRSALVESQKADVSVQAAKVLFSFARGLVDFMVQEVQA